MEESLADIGFATPACLRTPLSFSAHSYLAAAFLGPSKLMKPAWFP